ncbi:alpha/beta fold family hydrolase [Nitzschia inconspicua]|uniref:Alpha/beta fold family hydrolase n=1 Tax=Nitzschia inconspicua TaxID=303405 RepID=A0A9K3PID5_9STRA|nr:alpha/beta fold family hydrolase [Nitzschia inconspicua]
MTLDEPQEITLTCQDGVKLAGRRWIRKNGNEKETRVLCLHGWMDNCFTFNRLADGLLKKIPLSTDLDIVALDFPGHGLSSHKSLDGPSVVLADLVYYMYDALQSLNWETANLTVVGHSMGSSVALLFAAAFPLGKLIMLDSLGPQTKPADEISKSVRAHIKARIRGKPPSSVYPDLDTAIETRCLTATVFPGNQYISRETAKALVERASIIREDGQLEFLHDQRLKWPSLLVLTDAQLDQLYMDVASHPTETCLLTAQDGMPFPPDSISRIRELLQPKVVESLPGSHHFHADPDTADAVVDTIVSFIS